MSSKQMSHQSKKRKKMESSASASSSPLHFFKIIQAHAIKHKRLGIPEEFLKKFGNELSDSAIIKVPSGSIWRIGLTNRGGVTSFEYGCQEFMEFYSISVGHLLVFRYNRNSRFHVLIFDISATEIEYPVCNFKTNFKNKAQEIDTDSCSSDSNNENSTQSEPSSSRESQVNLETEPVDEHDFPKQRKVFAATVTTKRSRFNTSRVTESNERALRAAEAFSSDSNNETSTQNVSSSSRGGQVNMETEEPGNNVTQAKERALAAAEAFTSGNPFFKAVRRPFNISNGLVNMPGNFATPYLKHRTALVTLSVSDGKLWDVSLTSSIKSGTTTLSKGWKQFVSDNQLNQGDVCVFEPVDPKKFEMNVHIFRVFQQTCSGKKLETNAHRAAISVEKSFAAANAFKSKKPYFKVTMCRTYLTLGHVIVPAAFAVPYLEHEIKVRISGRGGKTWEMQCNLLHKPDRAKLLKGWDKFVLDNHLNEGDVCVFELVDRERFEMKAYIFRVVQSGE
ncbi:hypothetical protein C5167_037214 [Papaver somniferum]|uniref:TF-B3 domain-containing protein n=1 Tax=Papaver somniferum TaxID=3469 RepID=A0A4Y7I899_PAPSO|nr:hypothetical protein C5167_037214 [Papaver somniferum]